MSAIHLAPLRQAPLRQKQEDYTNTKDCRMRFVLTLIFSFTIIATSTFQLEAMSKKVELKKMDIIGGIESKNLRYFIVDGSTGEKYYFAPKIVNFVSKHRGKTVTLSAMVVMDRFSIQKILKKTIFDEE
jgi:hypothetical protein